VMVELHVAKLKERGYVFLRASTKISSLGPTRRAAAQQQFAELLETFSAV
jgi:hypothetical protein